LTEWQPLPCQLSACPSRSLYLHSSLHGAEFTRACVALSQRHGVSGRCGRAAAPSGTFPDSQKEQRHAWSPGKSSEHGHFLSFPSTAVPQSPPRSWRIWYLRVQADCLPKKRKSGGEGGKGKVQRDIKKMGTGETLHSVFK